MLLSYHRPHSSRWSQLNRCVRQVENVARESTLRRQDGSSPVRNKYPQFDYLLNRPQKQSVPTHCLAPTRPGPEDPASELRQTGAGRASPASEPIVPIATPWRCQLRFPCRHTSGGRLLKSRRSIVSLIVI